MLNLYSNFFLWFIDIFILVLASTLASGLFGLILFFIFEAWLWLFKSTIPWVDKHEAAFDKAAVVISVVIALPLFFLTWSVLNDQIVARQKAESWEKHWVSTGVHVEPFTLLAMSPPKHFYVTLRHDETGSLYERTYVSKENYRES